MPAARYSSDAIIPSRDPSAAPPMSTTISCMVSGTGVNGSGTLICAAAAVAAAIRATAPTRMPAEVWAPAASVDTSVFGAPARCI